MQKVTFNGFKNYNNGYLKTKSVLEKEEEVTVNPFELTREDVNRVLPIGWKTKLLDITSDKVRTRVIVTIMNSKKEIAKIDIKNLHGKPKNWFLRCDIDQSKENEVYLIEANQALQKVHKLILEKHPENLRILVGKLDIFGEGNGYLSNIDNYLIPIDEKDFEKWESEIEDMANAEFIQLNRGNRNPSLTWQINVVPGERSEKFLSFLTNTGYFIVENNKKIQFNKGISDKLSCIPQLCNRVTEWINGKGIIIKK